MLTYDLPTNQVVKDYYARGPSIRDIDGTAASSYQNRVSTNTANVYANFQWYL